MNGGEAARGPGASALGGRDPVAFAPSAWPWALRSPARASSESTPWRGALLRAWTGTSPLMEQPPLDHHYIVMHLGGAKHVTRRCDGPRVSTPVEDRSLTLVPAGTSYVWHTHGPIAFAHLYLAPQRLASLLGPDVAAGADGAAGLAEQVGLRDPELQPLMGRMLDEIRLGPSASTLLLDTLLEGFCHRLGHSHLAGVRGRPAAATALAPHRLRRVLAFIDANLASDIALADLVAAAGSSQSHFSRAFRLATGRSPYRYLLERRIDRARTMLLTSADSLETISAGCGFQRKQQFSFMFKRAVGIGPKRFRTMHSRRG